MSERIMIFGENGVKIYSSEKLFLETVRIRMEFNSVKNELSKNVLTLE